MSLRLTIFAYLFANFLFSYGYEAKPISVKPQSIVEVIVNNVDISNSTREIAKHSKYLEECRKINFSEKVNLTDTNFNKLLCFAIYDGFTKIGYSDNGTKKSIKTENASALNNQTMFDRAIETIKSNGTNPWNFCTNLRNHSLPVFNRTGYFVALLELKFDTNQHCTDICVIPIDAINPLCIILKIIDEHLRLKVEDSMSIKKDMISMPTKNPNYQKINDLKNVETEKNISQIDLNSHNIKIGTNGSKTSESIISAINHEIRVPSAIESSKGNSNITHHNKDKVTKLDPASNESPIKNIVENTEQNPLNAIDIVEDNGEAINSKKLTTISEKTLNIDHAEQPPDYNIGMTGDNDQISDLDNGDSMDDVQSTKQIQQPEIDLIDKKENVPRLPSMRKEDDSHFFGYFTIIGLIGISVCLIYHRKQKILAMIVEGRRSRSGRGRKRPSTANYRKLDCNLEEAVTSQCNTNVTHVIY